MGLSRQTIAQFVRLSLFSCLSLTGLLIPLESFAQTRSLPRPAYYLNFARNGPFYQADYKDAIKNFTRGANSAFKRGDLRYLDSICYWTMIGECHYHVGQYAEALARYEQSLQLYIQYQKRNWQSRVTPPTTIQADASAYQRTRINWGTPKRRASIARIPNSFSVLFGRLDAPRAFREGGVLDQAQTRAVDVTEIMRCTALCLHRRRTIQGPTAKYDPFSSELVANLNRGSKIGSVLGAFNGVLLGIAQASMEDWDKATRSLKNALQLTGGLDHPLTPVALVELANIGRATGNDAVAADLALEASFSAAVFQQFDLIEEALSIGTQVHLKRSQTPYPPLKNAISWGNANKARLLQASLISRLAECYAESGDSASALQIIRQANGPINRRNSLGQSVVSARLKYLSALSRFLEADFQKGQSELAAALEHFQTGSLWLYRLALADQLIANGRVTQRQVDLLYTTLLRDPNEADWQTDPMEAIAFLASPHVGSMERWFDIVVDRKNNGRALEVADLVRRHRFFANLPLGGRLMAFRWMMHAPQEALTAKAITQRADFFKRNPAYKQLSDRAAQIRTQLLTLPIKPEPKSDQQREQNKLLTELAAISSNQEAILASYALRREPAEMVFPPQMLFSEFQNTIKPDQIALVALETGSGYHTFLVNSQAVKYNGISKTRNVVRSVSRYLKTLGVSGVAMDLETIQDENWKKDAVDLKSEIFPGVADANWSDFRELVIVPDGAMWYLPFETLPIGEDEDQKFLSDILNIRYCPTLFLAFRPQRPAQASNRSGVVTGRLHKKNSDNFTSVEYDELVKDIPDAAKFDTPIRVASNYLAAQLDQLVVWSNIKQNRNSPLALTPLQLEQSEDGSTIGDWMSLPWEGPQHIVMPGFHSDAGTGLKRRLNGNDLFLVSLGLMASGTRTALISRWATGGKTSLALTRQYTTEINKVGTANAITKSRRAIRESKIDYENEPRVKSKKSNPELDAKHPFFWAGHMLLEIPDNAPPIAADIDNADAQPADDDGAKKDNAEEEAEAANEKNDN